MGALCYCRLRQMAQEQYLGKADLAYSNFASFCYAV
jgi:hypothetical protein